MSDAMFGELLGIIATANTTNRLANGYQIPVDEIFKS
jgi:alkylhydroperoxidase family enzyme